MGAQSHTATGKTCLNWNIINDINSWLSSLSSLFILCYLPCLCRLISLVYFILSSLFMSPFLPCLCCLIFRVYFVLSSLFILSYLPCLFYLIFFVYFILSSLFILSYLPCLFCLVKVFPIYFGLNFHQN